MSSTATASSSLMETSTMENGWQRDNDSVSQEEQCDAKDETNRIRHGDGVAISDHGHDKAVKKHIYDENENRPDGDETLMFKSEQREENSIPTSKNVVQLVQQIEESQRDDTSTEKLQGDPQTFASTRKLKGDDKAQNVSGAGGGGGGISSSTTRDAAAVPKFVEVDLDKQRQETAVDWKDNTPPSAIATRATNRKHNHSNNDHDDDDTDFALEHAVHRTRVLELLEERSKQQGDILTNDAGDITTTTTERNNPVDKTNQENRSVGDVKLDETTCSDTEMEEENSQNNNIVVNSVSSSPPPPPGPGPKRNLMLYGNAAASTISVDGGAKDYGLYEDSTIATSTSSLGPACRCHCGKVITNNVEGVPDDDRKRPQQQTTTRSAIHHHHGTGDDTMITDELQFSPDISESQQTQSSPFDVGVHGKKSKSVFHRLYEDSERREKRKSMIRSMLQREEDKELTFQPRTNVKHRKSNVRLSRRRVYGNDDDDGSYDTDGGDGENRNGLMCDECSKKKRGARDGMPSGGGGREVKNNEKYHISSTPNIV